MTIEELLDATAQATAAMSVDDNRVGAEITERTVRYYVTLGIVRPPVRDGGRSYWTRDHVNDLVRIRRAQSLGQTLKQLPRFRDTGDAMSWRLANVARSERPAIQTSETLSSTPAEGWAMRVVGDITLVGLGSPPPTNDQLEAIRNILGLHN